MIPILVVPTWVQMQTIVKKFNGIWFTLVPSPDGRKKFWSRGTMTGFNPNHLYDERMCLNAQVAIRRLSNRGVITAITVRGPLPTKWFFGPVNY